VKFSLNLELGSYLKIYNDIRVKYLASFSAVEAPNLPKNGNISTGLALIWSQEQ
jgi:hypothetical protein